ncbi:MAG: DEAD/DEAH box helicase [Flavobacteriales bacterium]|nr:DEAD/DEAH box helicase [Flavobacteriales bacterium]
MLNFELLGLSKPVMRAIAELGFETPTPIQEQAIPVMLGGNQDVVALAQTGTGKTAAFGLPLVDLLNFEERHTQALILAPTRELCMQITRDLQNFSKYMGGAHVTAIYGGASIDGQIRDVRKGPQIIAATPGRLVDMIERGVVDLSKIDFVVLDEADEMLTMGFKDDLDLILSQTPKEKNTWLFSATMPHEVQRIARNYMTDPHEVTIGQKNSGNENIEHLYYVVHAKDRYLALKRIADFNPDIFAIVFCRTKAETQQVADQLIKDGYNADALHGDLSQAQRDFVMKRYRSRSLQMLVATDVAARGIDVNDVTHVINYNLPDEIESYTHRSGRTARAGKTGVSIAIIHSKEMHKIREIEKIIKRKFTQAQIPTGFDVCEQQLISLVKKVHNVEVDEKSIERYLPSVFSELEELSREDIIKRFVSIEFNRFMEYYRNAPDLNMNASQDDRRKSPSGVVKMYINVGQMDGFDFNSLKDFIAENADIKNTDVTWTDVKNTFSLIEVRTEVMEKIVDTIHGAQYRGRTVRVESRGNRDAGIPRTRLRSDKRRDGGGYGGGRSFEGGGRSHDGGGRKSFGGRSGGGDRDRGKKGKKKKAY